MLLRTCIGWIHIEERVMMLGWAASVRAHPVGYMPRNVGAAAPHQTRCCSTDCPTERLGNSDQMEDSTPVCNYDTAFLN